MTHNRHLKHAIIVSLTLIVLVTQGSRVLAADVWHTATVRSVYPQASGSFVLTFDTDSAACTSTSSPKYYYVVVNQNSVTEEGAKKIYAAALLAVASDKQLQVNFSDLTTYCYINRVAVVK